MFSTRLYYHIKPFIPWRVRIGLRRWRIKRQLPRYADIWPIKEGTQKPPPNWPGWPDGKQFAVVLTHDVEGPEGLKRCRALMELEKSLGFRSAFYFIPEGPYPDPVDLRRELVENGFEVGVHDLNHDGKLYASREGFRRKAEKINHYLKAWNAVGFRSAFMHHNLDWLHDLDIQYDASTFDTDPFEPQPDGVDTIFPFWVPAPEGQKTEGRDQKPEVSRQKSDPLTSGTRPLTSDLRPLSSGKTGYIELPYTLPQDSTLFLLFQCQTLDTWKEKLKWVANNGGMVLVVIHPDYVAASDHPTESQSALSLEQYREFLTKLRKDYGDRFWNATPRDTATWVIQPRPETTPNSVSQFPIITTNQRHTKTGQKIWIDLDNTPHVPFFKPIIRELEKRNYSVVITARDAFQVCELMDKSLLPYRRVGKHHGKNRLMKITGLMYRSWQLRQAVCREHPFIGISHGSRSQIMLCNVMRLPSILLEDYEYAQFPALMRPTWKICPDSIPDAALAHPENRIRKYPGLKEDAYVPFFEPDPALKNQIGLVNGTIVVTVRPPATEAHYHNPESEVLFCHVMRQLTHHPEVTVVLLPRNASQGEWIRSRWPEWFSENKVKIPKQAIDGLNLLWHSDLVVSGGGTMNREAAALGVPVYSIFRGTIGAVDKQLEKEGRLVLLDSTASVDAQLQIRHRERGGSSSTTKKATLETILNHLEEIFALCPDVASRSSHSQCLL